MKKRVAGMKQRVVAVAVRDDKVAVYSMHNVNALSAMNDEWFTFESMPTDEVLGEAVLACREASRTFVSQADVDQHVVDGEERFRRYLKHFGLRSLRAYNLGVHEFRLFFVEDGTVHFIFGKDPYTHGHRSSVKEFVDFDAESAVEIGRFCKALLKRIEEEEEAERTV